MNAYGSYSSSGYMHNRGAAGAGVKASATGAAAPVADLSAWDVATLQPWEEPASGGRNSGRGSSGVGGGGGLRSRGRASPSRLGPGAPGVRFKTPPPC